MKKLKKSIAIVVTTLTMGLSLSGCGEIQMGLKELKGDLVGNSFNAVVYDNYGNAQMTVHGNKVNVEGNIVKNHSVDNDGKIITNYELSSVLTVNIDGHQMTSCGDTLVFYEEGLEPDVDFVALGLNLETTPGGIEDSTFISGLVNKYKNKFGKSSVVVVKSQMGTPICAFSGDKVTWKVADDIPKFTRVLVDGKIIYLHRNNFNIIDIGLMN